MTKCLCLAIGTLRGCQSNQKGGMKLCFNANVMMPYQKKFNHGKSTYHVSFCVLREKVCFNSIIYSITRLLWFPLQRYSNSSSSSSSPPQEVMQVNAVSSSTDCLGKRGRILAPPLRPGLQGPLPFNITSPCLERLLRAKESIVTPYAAGGCSRRL